VSGALSGVGDLDTPWESTLTYTKHLQEKTWYLDLLPGDSDFTEVSIWFYDNDNAFVVTEEIGVPGGQGPTITRVPTRLVTGPDTYTLTKKDVFVLCNSTAGNITITVPPAKNCKGHRYLLKKRNSTFSLIVKVTPSSGDKIDDLTSWTLTTGTPPPAMQIISDGANGWWIV